MTESKRNTSALDWKSLMAGQTEFLKPLVQEVLQQVLEAETAEPLPRRMRPRRAAREGHACVTSA